MTKAEFIERAKKENWPDDYLKGTLKIAEDAETDGFVFPYEFILEPPPIPVR